MFDSLQSPKKTFQFLDFSRWVVRVAGPSRRKTPVVPERPKVPFQAEPEEGLPRPTPKNTSSQKRLFDPESGESDSDSTQSECGESQANGILSFGWHGLHSAAKARFQREVSAAGKHPKQKRHYNNASREARGAYVRKTDTFKKNGMSSTRITAVLCQDQCLCS